MVLKNKVEHEIEYKIKEGSCRGVKHECWELEGSLDGCRRAGETIPIAP